MRSKQAAIWKIKCILLISRRVIRRRVERVKAMPFCFNVRSVGQGKSHASKNGDGAIKHLGKRVERAALKPCAGQGNVDIGERFAFFLGAKFLGAFFNRGRDSGTNFVEQFSNNRLFVATERFHLLSPRRNAAAAPEVTNANGLERFLVRGCADFAQRALA